MPQAMLESVAEPFYNQLGDLAKTSGSQKPKISTKKKKQKKKRQNPKISKKKKQKKKLKNFGAKIDPFFFGSFRNHRERRCHSWLRVQNGNVAFGS